MRLFKFFLLFLLFALYSCSSMFLPQTITLENNIEHEIQPISCYVDKYVKENLGTTYSLYQVGGKVQNNEYTYLEFIYTKRAKHFNDVYFFTVYPNSNSMVVNRQSEAERLYGRNHVLDIGNLDWELSDLYALQASTDFDTIEFNSTKEKTVIIKYLKSSEVIATVDYTISSK